MLDGMLDALGRCLDAESARRVVELRVSPSVQERIDALAERANEGALTGDEAGEYEALINTADFISCLLYTSPTSARRSGPERVGAASRRSSRSPPHPCRR